MVCILIPLTRFVDLHHDFLQSGNFWGRSSGARGDALRDGGSRTASRSFGPALPLNLGGVEVGVLDAVKDRRGRDAGQPVDLGHGLAGVGLPGFMGDHDDGHRTRDFPALLDHRGDADVVFSQDARDLGQDPGLVQGGKPEIVVGHQVVDGFDEPAGC